MIFTIIEKYFPSLEQKKLENLNNLGFIYREWNKKINIISRKDIDNLYERHILHSLSIAKIITFNKNTKILDVGTGGGFPGIPLSIIFPECQFTLVDSINKKIKIVENIASELNLNNISPINIRAEKINEKFDFIVSRAVTQFPDFLNLVKNNFSKNNFNTLNNGIFYIKGGDFDKEIKDFKNITIYNINDFFNEEFFKTKKIIYLPM